MASSAADPAILSSSADEISVSKIVVDPTNAVFTPYQNGCEGNGDNNSTASSRVPYGEMTSKDYYFDSYAHFGIHEVSFSYDFTKLKTKINLTTRLLTTSSCFYLK